MPEQLTQDLISLLGMNDFIRLIENYGGLRQYIPRDIEKSEMSDFLGYDVMAKLSRHYEGVALRIPIGRVYLAQHYRQLGLSDRMIAANLRITENSVLRLFKRNPTRRPPRRSHSDPRQIDMFS